MGKYCGVNKPMVKIGTGFFFEESPGDENGYRLRHDQMDALTEEVAAIAHDGRKITIVTSGAIATGAHFMRKDVKKDSHERAQLAGVGQPILFARYVDGFAKHGTYCAQYLIDSDDLLIESRRKNLLSVQEGHFRDGVVGIYNENDALSTDEITFGDNDILAANLAWCLGADLLVMMSNPVGILGTGVGESKEKAREILAARHIPVEIINGRYERDGQVWKPKIRELI